jgi:hypothetical protein
VDARGISSLAVVGVIAQGGAKVAGEKRRGAPQKQTKKPSAKAKAKELRKQQARAAAQAPHAEPAS